MRARSVFPALCLALLLLAPLAAAHHPGTNQGLAGLLGPAQENRVHNVVDVDEALARWDATWPGLVDRFTIGQSSTLLPLYGVRVTDESLAYEAANLSTGHKLRVYLDGGHHGNEYMGVELVMYYLEDLLTKAGEGDTDALGLLQRMEIYAVPLVNPEGNAVDTRKNGRQVDLNRNYPYMWGGLGSGDTPAEFTYRGPGPASEREVQANIGFAEDLSPDLWITMHTGIAEFYWPWGFTHDPSPDDWMFRKIEKPFEEATNHRVDAMQAAALYLAAGATDDFGYGELGIPTFTYEVHEDQFIPVYGEPIPDILADQLAGLDWMVRHTPRLGAWVEPALTADGVVLENLGWGNATHVTVTVDGVERTVAHIPAGGSVVLQGEAAREVTVTYPALHIDTSRVRTHTLTAAALDAADVDDSALTVPAPTPLLMVAALALGLALARRHSP